MSEHDDPWTRASRGPDPVADDQSDGRIAGLLRVVANSAPPLSEDPIAAMLGLIPDDLCRLDSRRLKQMRQKTGRRASQLAQQLRSRGWQYTAADVAEWERNDKVAGQLPPAVVQAIAATLNVEVAALIGTDLTNAAGSRFDMVKQDNRFRDLAARWAKARQISMEAAIAALDSRMVATVHRGDEPDVEQTLASLDALVSSVERSSRD